jgi:putative molybdopterin biosynthesis protein
VSNADDIRSGRADLLAAVRAAARQEQFLEVVSPEEAQARFAAAVDFTPQGKETVALAATLGRVLAADVLAPIDVPPFDRSGVDGFAVRAADTTGATEGAPLRLLLNAEVLACGTSPRTQVRPGTATAIATGGMIPRGADAVVMIEHTELIETPHGPTIDVRHPVAPGQFVGFAGTDIARGETVLRQGTQLTSREVGMLAACGLAAVEVVRRPKVAILGTGDELVQPGEGLRPGAVYDSNSAIIAAAVAEAGGEPVAFGAFPDDEAALEAALRQALAACDIVLLSGGTSKGAGDLSYRIVSRIGRILVHGVALKPGKPLCLAVEQVPNKHFGKPIAVLPGFPTSAIFTFHAFIAPLIRARAGLPKEATQSVNARVPVRVASELGRREFVLVALTAGKNGLTAFPTGKGSGAVTAFSQADGFLAVDALATALDAGATAEVTLIGARAHLPELVIMGSHCVALDVVLSRLSEEGIAARSIAVGSTGGVAAVTRGECDIAPVHLLDPASERYNAHLLKPGLTLVRGWERMQGFVFRAGDARFAGKAAAQALQAALADPSCLMVNRNAGAGTRILIDRLLAGARPPGYANQPRSHNAVAAAVAQGRADWGIAIATVASMYGLAFLPVAPEHYDFLIADDRRDGPSVQAFLNALRAPDVRTRIAALGMRPSDEA